MGQEVLTSLEIVQKSLKYCKVKRGNSIPSGSGESSQLENGGILYWGPIQVLTVYWRHQETCPRYTKTPSAASPPPSHPDNKYTGPQGHPMSTTCGQGQNQKWDPCNSTEGFWGDWLQRNNWLISPWFFTSAEPTDPTLHCTNTSVIHLDHTNSYSRELWHG